MEVVDSDVAPVRGLSLSIARANDEGGGEGEEAVAVGVVVAAGVVIVHAPCLDRTCTVPVSLITGHSAFASSHTFYGGAWISVGTTSRLCWQKGESGGGWGEEEQGKGGGGKGGYRGGGL